MAEPDLSRKLAERDFRLKRSREVVLPTGDASGIAQSQALDNARSHGCSPEHVLLNAEQ